MDIHIQEEMRRIVDEYCPEPGLHQLVTLFLDEKVAEKSTWGEITCSVHGMLGGTSEQIIRAAALTEIMILVLDIIDDLQDQDNAAKPWMSCPEPYTLNAILAFMAAFIGELNVFMSQASNGSSASVKELGQLLAAAVSGQQRDIDGSIRTEQEYIDMVQHKSGSLIRFACFMGYALAENTQSSNKALLYDLADCIGIIAQIGNDLNDLIRYDVKNDLLHRKRTLPILFLLVDSDEEFPVLSQYYNGVISRDDFLLHKQECLEYVRSSGCIEYSRVIQALYKERMDQLLESIPDSPWKERFVKVAVG